MASSVDVSVVLPVFNEEDHLEQEVARVRQGLDTSDYSYEIIVIDDGSSDGSWDVIRRLDGVRAIRFASNRGSGTARRIGSQAAKGDIVVWTDVDLTYPNDQIADLVDALDGSDQVVGARRTEEGTLKAFRVPAKWFIRKLASYLVEFTIPDLNSGFRAFRRDVGAQFLHQLPVGFSCVTTLTLAFLSEGYQVRYVPIEYAKRAGRSKFHWWSDTKRYLVQVIRMVLGYNPLRVFLPLAFALILLAFGKLAFDWVTRDFALAANTLLLFLAAFNALAIGLLADLVVRTSRRRDLVPSAIVTELSPARSSEPPG